MTWDRSITLAVSRYRCVHCHGSGLVAAGNGRRRRVEPCRCVLREVCRECVSLYHRLDDTTGMRDRRMERPITLGRLLTAGNWDRPGENYRADIYLTARRALTGRDWDVFQLYWLAGRPWKERAHRLCLDRGSVFHFAYRSAAKAGRAFAELTPLPLSPPGLYFA